MNNHSNKITIGLPVFNGGKYLETAINSLLAQSHEDFELIISDNCSTDETEIICKKYEKLDCRVIYFKQNENIGAYKNFLFTLNQAKYEYFMWAAADDEWHPDFVKSNFLKLTASNKVAVSFCGIECRKIGENNIQKIDLSKLNNINNKYDLIRELLTQKKYNFFIYGLFKKNILKQCFSHQCEFIDRWLLLPIALSGYKIVATEKVFYYRTVYNQKINERHSKSKSKINVGYFALFKSSWNSSNWIENVLNRKLSLKELCFIKFYSIKFASYKFLKYIYSTLS